MPDKARILIVEDEAIIAMDVQARSTRLGHSVVGIASTGAEAVDRTGALQPDIVLMDVRLRGAIDGIQAAEGIRRAGDAAVIFLATPGDTPTLERAGITEPFGYILKPVADRELDIAVRIGLFRQAADRKLREMERWTAGAPNSMGDAVFSADLAGRLTHLNGEAERMVGLSAQGALGRTLEEVAPMIDAGSGCVTRDLVARVLREGIVIGPAGRTTLRTADGREVPVDLAAAPIRADRGPMTGVTLILRHVSTQRDEETKRRAERRSQTMEAIGRVAGGMAHHFNNLMTVVLGQSERALAQLGADPAQAARLRDIQEAARRAAKLTALILATSRRQYLIPKTLDLSATVEGLRNALRRVVGEGITLDFRLPPTPPVLLDPEQLEEVLVQLAANARDAMPSGGALRIEVESTEVSAGLDGEPDQVPAGRFSILTVADMGCGMDAETRARLFEPFFTTKAPGQGAGLGLAMVYGFVKQSGGHCQVESEPGNGALFRLYFPTTEGPAAPSIAGGKTTPLPSPAGMDWILVVDDAPEVRVLLGELLREWGYAVVEARSAEEALNLAPEHGGKLSLLVADVVLPGMSGPQLAERLRPSYPGLEAIFISGYPREELIGKGLLAREVELHPKPLDIGRMLATLKRLYGHDRGPASGRKA